MQEHIDAPPALLRSLSWGRARWHFGCALACLIRGSSKGSMFYSSFPHTVSVAALGKPWGEGPRAPVRVSPRSAEGMAAQQQSKHKNRAEMKPQLPPRAESWLCVTGLLALLSSLPSCSNPARGPVAQLSCLTGLQGGEGGREWQRASASPWEEEGKEGDTLSWRQLGDPAPPGDGDQRRRGAKQRN